MPTLTFKSLLYLYNEMAGQEAADFRSQLYSNRHLENDFYLLKQQKELLDHFLLLQSPSSHTISKILAFAAK